MTHKLRDALHDKKRIAFLGSYGFGNLGDEAILSVLLDEAPTDSRVTILSRSPDASAALHGKRAVQVRGPRAIATTLGADAVVIGGGGIFSGLAGRQTDALAAFLRGLQVAGKDLYFWAMGIYPDTRPGTLRRTVRALRRARLVTVRDATSFELLRRYGVSCAQVPDPAFSLVPAALADAERALAEEGIPVGGPYVGVSPRRVRDPALQERLARELVRTLRLVQEGGESVLFLPTAHHPFASYTNDLDYSRELAEQLDPDHAFVVSRLHHPRLAASLFRVPRTHLTMRLHALVFASLAGRTAVPIAYADKVADVAKEIGVEPVQVGEVEATALAARLAAAHTLAR